MVNSPDASGSGNALTPLSRMQSALLIPFHGAVFALAVPVSEGASSHSPR